MAAVAGLRGTGDWATDERPKNFREMILFRNPNGTTPIFALTSRVQKESTDDPEYNWWDEPNDLVRLQVSGALGSGDTTVVVDSADPSSGAPGNVWGVATHLKPGDHLLVEPAADSATFNHEVIEVVQVISATSFTVKRGAQGTTPASIGNDAFLLLIGSAYAEGTAAPEAVSRNPIKYNNYTQIFKDAYELTGTAEETRTRTGNPVQNDKKRKMWDHARAIEFALLFGRQSETVGSNGKPKRTMRGLRASIPAATTTVFSAAYTLNDLMDALSPVFDFDTEAGDSRIIFSGNAALNIFNQKIAAQTGAAQVQFAGRSKTYGMTFNEYAIPQGMLHIRTHPLLNRHALYKNSWIVVDFSALRYRPMKNRDTKAMDNIQNKDEDLRRGQWRTECGLEVRYGGLTCGYIGGLDAT